MFWIFVLKRFSQNGIKCNKTYHDTAQYINMNLFRGNGVVSFMGIKLKRYLIMEPNPPPYSNNQTFYHHFICLAYNCLFYLY